MIFKKMKRNCFLRLFSIVLAIHTIQDGLWLNVAASASHKGMREKRQRVINKYPAHIFNVCSSFLDCSISETTMRITIKATMAQTQKTNESYFFLPTPITITQCAQ